MWHLAFGYLGLGLGTGLCLLAAAFGIARLASAALEGTARQPEAANALRTSMIIPAALIEGLGFFALVICLLGILTLNSGVPKSTQGEASQTVEAHH
ncbi:MAG: ATP synthase F0 subunit C [Elusimicrobia bacterium]|nr:ATP synthase F0 subunit C [Elusimicrobiota bacterium]